MASINDRTVSVNGPKSCSCAAISSAESRSAERHYAWAPSNTDIAVLALRSNALLEHVTTVRPSSIAGCSASSVYPMTYVQEWKAFDVTVADGVAEVTLIGPGKGNAMGPDFWSELVPLFGALDVDGDVRAVV